MKLYVAAKFEDAPRAQMYMAWLRNQGHIITYDWTQHEQASQEQALSDKQGVMDADALVLIAVEHLAYCGAMVEMGVAVARGIPIYVIGNALDDRCIFLHLPQVRRDWLSLIRPVLAASATSMHEHPSV